MNNWLSKKLQNQFKTQDLTRTALSKLQQLENKQNVTKVHGKTPQEANSQCPNCSTMSGLNNTINIALRTDLMNKTDLNNVTTVEEICRDPGFQEFLFAQLDMYYKFIVNSSNNTLLSSAKSRSSFMDNRQGGCISVTDPGPGAFGTSQFQSGSGSTVALEELSRPIDYQQDPALSLIEEEVSREEQYLAVDSNKAQNHLVGRSSCNNTAKNNKTVSLQPLCLTQRLKDKLLQKPVNGPKPSLPVSSKNSNTLKTSSDKSPTKFHDNEEIANTSVVDKLARTRSSSACSNAETSERPSRLGRKRSSKTAAIDPADVAASQSNDGVFKKPLPPKRKANPTRRYGKRSTATDDSATEDESRLAEIQQTHDAGVKALNRQKASVAKSIKSELNETSYVSRRGRVSKPPGVFWNPLTDDRQLPSQTRKTVHPSRGPQTKENVKPSSTTIDNQLLRSSVADVDSESGYSSVISGRKSAQSSRLTRTEQTNGAAENLASFDQAPKKPPSVKPPASRGTFNRVDAVKDSQVKDQVSADDTHKTRRGRLRKTASEETLVGSVENIASMAPSGKAVAARPSRPAAAKASRPTAAEKANASKPVTDASKQVAVTRNIFSDSNSSSDDECSEVSDAIHNRRQGINSSHVARQIRPLLNSKLTIVDDSSDEEEPAEVRQPARSRNTQRIPAVSRPVPWHRRDEKLIVDSSSNEEDASVVRRQAAKKKQPAVKKPRGTTPTKQLLVPDESPMVDQKVQSLQKGRFLFAGSSTEEESVCSYRTSDRNAKRAGSESFEDDASYESVTRTSREKEIPLEGNRNRRPAFVSRFRIRK